MAHDLEKAAKDVRDAVKEGVHRGNAEAEREMRDEYGDVRDSV